MVFWHVHLNNQAGLWAEFGDGTEEPHVFVTKAGLSQDDRREIFAMLGAGKHPDNTVCTFHVYTTAFEIVMQAAGRLNIA